MECSNQGGELIETVHLLPNENILTIALINIYYLFYMTPKQIIETKLDRHFVL